MPGSVSDSYDAEWGTAVQRAEIDDALAEVYKKLTSILGGKPPIDIRQLAKHEPISLQQPILIQAVLTERQWRLLRFAVERARESL